MTPSLSPARYECPECGSTTSNVHYDGIEAVECNDCDWGAAFDVRADEFASRELDRHTDYRDEPEGS